MEKYPFYDYLMYDFDVLHYCILMYYCWRTSFMEKGMGSFTCNIVLKLSRTIVVCIVDFGTTTFGPWICKWGGRQLIWQHQVSTRIFPKFVLFIQIWSCIFADFKLRTIDGLWIKQNAPSSHRSFQYCWQQMKLAINISYFFMRQNVEKLRTLGWPHIPMQYLLLYYKKFFN